MDVANCTCANLRKASRAVTQVFDAALQPSGIKATQFTLLAVLGRRGPLPITRLAEVLVMDRTTLTRNLKPVARKGLIRVERQDDQRVREVSLTNEGSAVLADALPRWEEAQSRMFNALGPERLAGFLEDLSATINVAQET